MSQPQQTPWRIDGGRVYDAYGNQVTFGLDNLEFVVACVNQHNELLKEREMKIDDAFLRAVLEKAGTHYPYDIIRATLAVAAERGLVVPDGAPRMWAVKLGDEFHTVRYHREQSIGGCITGETVVRVAIVEIKEDGK